MVGPAGFEPTTSCAPCMRATKLRYGPTTRNYAGACVMATGWRVQTKIPQHEEGLDDLLLRPLSASRQRCVARSNARCARDHSSVALPPGVDSPFPSRRRCAHARNAAAASRSWSLWDAAVERGASFASPIAAAAPCSRRYRFTPRIVSPSLLTRSCMPLRSSMSALR